MTTNSRRSNSNLTERSADNNNVSRSNRKTQNKYDKNANYDEYDLYESRDIEEFTSSDLNTLIAPNPLQVEKQFASIANLDHQAHLRLEQNAIESKHIPPNNNNDKKAAANLHLMTSQPWSKSSNNSSNVSTPFANMPKFKAPSSDDEGSDSEYGGEIKYYDLSKAVSDLS